MHIVHLFQVIVSLYLGNVNVLVESGKISNNRKMKESIGEYGTSYPLICPRISLLLVILETNLCSKRQSDRMVVLTLWKDEIRWYTSTDTDRRMMAHLFRYKFPAFIFSNTFISFSQEWIEIFSSRSIIIRWITRDNKCCNINQPQVSIICLSSTVQ